MPKLHHKIQPHHHVSIWALGLLSVLLSVSTYNNSLVLASSQTSAGGLPVDCQKAKQEVETETTAANPTVALEENRISTVASPKASATKSPETDTRTTAIPTVKSSQTAKPTPNPSVLLACKHEAVAQEKDHLKTFRGKIDTSVLPSLQKLDDAMTKITATIPTLQKNGADSTKVAKIQKDVTTVQTDSATLKTDVSTMKKALDQFDGNGTDSEKAYNDLKSSASSTLQTDITHNTTEISAAISDLKTTLTQLAK